MLYLSVHSPVCLLLCSLSDRAELEKKARRAQELWVACQMLQTALTLEDHSEQPFENRLRPLGPELSAITSAADLSDTSSTKILSTVVSSVPDVAVTRGVWTESALVNRFDRVYAVARRVAMVGEGETSLFRYALSYLMSLVVFRHPPPAADSNIDADQLTPFYLLDAASWSLEHGDLEQAVRYVNQLTGEARRVAADWLREARLLLETKQAAVQCHATQLSPDSVFAMLPPEIMRELQTWECFQLAESYVGEDGSSHDLLTGLGT